MESHIETRAELITLTLRDCRPLLIFPFGRGCGFGAEWVGVLKAIVTALHNGMGLRLFAIQPGVGVHVGAGWTEYFELPLVTLDTRFASTLWRQHHRFAARLPASVEQLIQSCYPGGIRVAAVRSVKNAAERCGRIGMTGDWWHDAELVASQCWIFAERAAEIVTQMVAAHNLPAEYIAVHIRRGDKVTERREPADFAYVRAIEGVERPDLPVVLLGDDRRYLEGFALTHLCGRESTIASRSHDGFVESAFNVLPAHIRFQRNCEFLADVEVMRSAYHVVGDAQSNVFYMTQYLRGCRDIVGVTAD